MSIILSMLKSIIIKIIVYFLGLVFLSIIIIFVTLVSIHFFGFGITAEGIVISRDFFIVSLIVFLLLLARVKKSSFKDFHAKHILFEILLPIVFVTAVYIISPEYIHIYSHFVGLAAFFSLTILAALIVVYLRIFDLLKYLDNFLMRVTTMDFYLNLFKKIFKKGDIQ